VWHGARACLIRVRPDTSFVGTSIGAASKRRGSGRRTDLAPTMRGGTTGLVHLWRRWCPFVMLISAEHVLRTGRTNRASGLPPLALCLRAIGLCYSWLTQRTVDYTRLGNFRTLSLRSRHRVAIASSHKSRVVDGALVSNAPAHIHPYIGFVP